MPKFTVTITLEFEGIEAANTWDAEDIVNNALTSYVYHPVTGKLIPPDISAYPEED